MKIAFFDIDGTLLDFGASDISNNVKHALNQLQSSGVKLFIATGRTPYVVPKFEGLTFDGMLCFNGGYCFDHDGVICKTPMDKEEVAVVTENAKNIGLPVLLATEKRMGANFFEQNLDDYMNISHQSCNIIEDFDELMMEDVYQMMVGSMPEQDESLLLNTKNTSVVRWWDRACDVIPSACGKDIAMVEILKHYGYEKEEAIAFGDGGNDRTMIQCAGIGIAMGNATDEVKQAADYVTDSCHDDGIVTALRHFGLIEE